MTGRTASFWQEQPPALMAALAAKLSEGDKYDAIIVDEAQDFADSGQPPMPLVPLVLDHNLCNTRGGDGPEVHFIPSADPPSDSDDAVDILLEAGWHPGNIALLTPGSCHPVQVELTEHRGQVGYWRTYWEDEVFTATSWAARDSNGRPSSCAPTSRRRATASGRSSTSGCREPPTT